MEQNWHHWHVDSHNVCGEKTVHDTAIGVVSVKVNLFISNIQKKEENNIKFVRYCPSCIMFHKGFTK